MCCITDAKNRYSSITKSHEMQKQSGRELQWYCCDFLTVNLCSFYSLKSDTATEEFALATLWPLTNYFQLQTEIFSACIKYEHVHNRI